MSYHSLHLEFPASAPFDRDNWFETFIGYFVKPLLATGLVKQYWFTRYGGVQRREIRLRLTTDNFGALGPIVQQQIRAAGFTELADEQDATLVSSLGGGRFWSPDSCSQSAEFRAQLMLNLHHALAALFVDSLIGPDIEGRFRQERSTEINNPHGSIFETAHHLFCNTTDVVTEVEVFRIGTNTLHVESPLYASYRKAEFHVRGIAVTEMGKIRVRF